MRYLDGNFQQMSQTEFRYFVSKFVYKSSSLDYVKAYIRPKSTSTSTLLISFDSTNIDIRMYNEVNHQIAYALD